MAIYGEELRVAQEVVYQANRYRQLGDEAGFRCFLLLAIERLEGTKGKKAESYLAYLKRNLAAAQSKAKVQ